MPELTYTFDEMMTIQAARMIRNGVTLFVGIGLPSAAANLARLTHAPDTVLIYESGTIGTKPDVLPLSIGDGELCETALTTTTVVEMFRYWLQGGRFTVGWRLCRRIMTLCMIWRPTPCSATRSPVRCKPFCEGWHWRLASRGMGREAMQTNRFIGAALPDGRTPDRPRENSPSPGRSEFRLQALGSHPTG